MTHIEKKLYTTPLNIKKTYFYDHIKKAEYRRVVGGVGFPFDDSPGFILILAENYNKDPRLKLRHYKILTEYENRDIDRLIQKMYDLQNSYLIDPWYGETENLLMMHFIDRFNRKLSKKKKGLYIAEAPFAEDKHNLQLYAPQIKSRLVPTKKSLILGDSSQVPGCLSGLTPDNERKDQAQKYPIIAALGFAVSGLDEPYADVSRDRELHEQHVQSKMVEGL